MLVLLPLLWLWSVWARDAGPQKDTKYVLKRISSCPDVGYFFRRESSPNALSGICYLCFCQNDGTAVCWQRENKRCDARSYKHGVGKRDTRVRRSPIGIGDIFFRDAARDIFNKQLPQVCKPYETSFSEGCPPVPGDKEDRSFLSRKLSMATHLYDAATVIAELPQQYDLIADWCTGCTVCDCDANGRWDCHVLSFCPDKNSKNKLKETRTPIKKEKPRPPKRTTSSSKKPTTKPAKKTTKQLPTRSNNKQIRNTSKTKPNNSIQKLNNASPKPLIIKKDPATKTPVLIKKDHGQLLLNKNETSKLTQEVYKKVAAAVHKMISKKLAATMSSLKSIQKRSLEKKNKPCVKNSKNAKKNVNGKFTGANKRQYKKTLQKKTTVQKKKFIPAEKPGNKNTNKVKRNSPKPVKAKKGVPTKKPTKPAKRVWRTKRDIRYNVTEMTGSSELHAETHLNITSQLTSTENVKLNNITNNENYFKYSLITPKSLLNATIQPKFNRVEIAATSTPTPDNITDMPDKKEKRESNISFPILKTNISKIGEKYQHSVPKSLPVDDVVPEYNDLKFNRRSQIKFIKNSRLFSKLLGLNATLTTNSTNATNYDVVTPKSQPMDIKRIVAPNPIRKYDRSKIVNTIRSLTMNSPITSLGNSVKERIFKKIEDLQGTLKKLLYELRKNNTTRIKPRRFNVIKYLKKFFRKVFKKRTGKGVINVNNKAVFNKYIVNTICENFEDCDKSQIDNPILNKNIKELYTESFTILKTINIIKGLLRFLEEPNSRKLADGKNIKQSTEELQSKFNNDIHTLSAVLRGNYIKSDRNLTTSEITQIEYIKKNTNAFISSVGRFANKLNEIIDILTKKSQLKQHVTRDVKTSDQLNLADIGTHNFIQLRNLLDRYTVIQENLVQKMQSSLHAFKSLNDVYQKKAMVDKHKNSTIKIIRYSDNIIRNLKKLKNLARMMAKSKSRRKRDLMRDDEAMEYLLTLMEYLLKQNNPLDSAPVNDGIDLLIEAIKSAPDIKPIKKKVLQAIHTNISIVKNNDVPLNLSKEDSSMDINNTISKEDNDTNDTRVETVEQISYHERDEDQPPRGRIIFEDTNTETVYYKKDTDLTETSNTPVIETTVVPAAYGLKGHVDVTTEHNNFDKLEQEAREDSKKIEVFIGDVDEEDSNIEVTSTTIAPDVEEKESVTVTVPMTTTDFKLPEIKERLNNDKSIEASGSSDGEKRIALDWLDDGEEQDTKEVKYTQNTTTQAITKETTKVTITTTKPSNQDNISSLTKEINDEDGRMKKSKVEDIMYKKQMDLLNSLDYGTERSDTEESRDGEERYSGDVFQSYF